MAGVRLNVAVVVAGEGEEEGGWPGNWPRAGTPILIMGA